MARALTLTTDPTKATRHVMFIDRRTHSPCVSQLERLGLSTWAQTSLIEALSALQSRRPRAIVLAATLAFDDPSSAWQLASAARDAGVALLLLTGDEAKAAPLAARLGAAGLLRELHFSRDVSEWLSRDFRVEAIVAAPPAKQWLERNAPAVPPEAVLAVDFAVLSAALPSLDEELQGLVRLFDGRRTVEEVVRDSMLDEPTTLAAATRFFLLGIVSRVKPAPRELARFKPAPPLFGVPSTQALEEGWGPAPAELPAGQARAPSTPPTPAHADEQAWAIAEALRILRSIQPPAPGPARAEDASRAAPGAAAEPLDPEPNPGEAYHLGREAAARIREAQVAADGVGPAGTAVGVGEDPRPEQPSPASEAISAGSDEGPVAEQRRLEAAMRWLGQTSAAVNEPSGAAREFPASRPLEQPARRSPAAEVTAPAAQQRSPARAVDAFERSDAGAEHGTILSTTARGAEGSWPGDPSAPAAQGAEQARQGERGAQVETAAPDHLGIRPANARDRSQQGERGAQVETAAADHVSAQPPTARARPVQGEPAAQVTTAAADRDGLQSPAARAAPEDSAQRAQATAVAHQPPAPRTALEGTARGEHATAAALQPSAPGAAQRENATAAPGQSPAARGTGAVSVQGENATLGAHQSPAARAAVDLSTHRESAAAAAQQSPVARTSLDPPTQRENAAAAAHHSPAAHTSTGGTTATKPLPSAAGVTALQVGVAPSSSATSAQGGADRVVIDPRSPDVALERTKSANEPPAPGARAVPDTQKQEASPSPAALDAARGAPGVDLSKQPTGLAAELRPRKPTPAPGALPVAAAPQKPQPAGRVSLEAWLATPARRPATPTPAPQQEPEAPMKSTRATIASPSRTPPPPEPTQPALPAFPAATWDDDDDEWESSKTFEPLRPRQKSPPVTVREALASTAEPSTAGSAQGADEGPEDLLRYRTRPGPILLGVAIALLLLAALVSWLSNAPPPQASPPAVETAAPELLEPAEPVASVLAEWKPWEPPPALEAAPATEPDVPAADLAAPLKDARDLYEAGRLKEATIAVQALLDANPSSAEAWVLLGQVRFDSRDLPGARAASTQALTLDPKFPRGLMLQAALAIDAKDRPAARDALERMLAVDPTGPDAAEARALLAHSL